MSGMKSIRAIVVVSLLVSLLGLAPAALATEPEAPSQAGHRKSLEAAMIKVCRKEFPDVVKKMNVDELDHWAEASETADGWQRFKKSRCFATHEKWEKLAERNEWSPESRNRMPASAPAAVPPTQ
jgi:hypothetical protein